MLQNLKSMIGALGIPVNLWQILPLTINKISEFVLHSLDREDLSVLLVMAMPQPQD